MTSLLFHMFYRRVIQCFIKHYILFCSLPKEEKQAAMKEAIKQEKLFRSEGKMVEMERILGPKAKVNHVHLSD